MILNDDDPGQVPETKIGGVPWWPNQTERPRCEHGHLMTFMNQIRLQDVPIVGENFDGLALFHYCMECTYSGNMSFGFDDPFGNRGYDVRVFRGEILEDLKPDGLGIVAEEILPSYSVTFSEGLEIPRIEDMGEDIDDVIPEDYPQGKDDFDENIYPGFIHVRRTKIGGWPSWVQDAQWPIVNGVKMTFIGQIDWEIGVNAPWCSGGYAYLFVNLIDDKAWKGELVIEDT